MDTMNRKKLKSAEVLIKYSWMSDHQGFKTTDCEMGVIDWALIERTNWTFHQAILVEVLKFLVLEESNVSLDDLMALYPYDRQAVLTALNVKFAVTELQENLEK
jgi:hypothetical protein